MGHQADLATNRVEVLDALTTKSYDAILMDVQMPTMDGLETTRTIRQHHPNPKTRPYVIALTANEEEGDRAACLEAGMDGFLAKPLKMEQLEQALRQVFDTGCLLYKD